MSKAKYIVRLDDASPTMKRGNWDRFETVLDRYKIKPIVAVIPNNKDKKQQYDPADPFFWEKVRKWQKKGWIIALHGYDHVYITQKSGLVPINKKSEFAGLDVNKQREKIKKGIEIFKENGITPLMWIAPSHSFDRNTLQALKAESEIEIISDGVAYKPFTRFGFKWIPQQLWDFKKKKFGVWTGCFHPNTMTAQHFKDVETFLEENYENFTDVNELTEFSPKGISDYFLTIKFYAKRWFVENFLDRKKAN